LDGVDVCARCCVLAAVIVVFRLLFNVRPSCYLLNNLLNNLHSPPTFRPADGESYRVGHIGPGSQRAVEFIDAQKLGRTNWFRIFKIFEQIYIKI